LGNSKALETGNERGFKMLTSWKTTVCGILAAVAYAAQTADWTNWKTFAVSGALAALGFMAKDHNVTGGTVQQ